MMISLIISYILGRKHGADDMPPMKLFMFYLEHSFLVTKKCPTSSLHKEDLKKEQMEWSKDFILPDRRSLQDLTNHAANSESGDFGEWRLVEHVKNSFGFVKVFEGKLYFNAKKQQLVLVCIDNLGCMKLVLSRFSESASVKFGDRVRLLVNEFKVRPQVLVTGQGGGGLLAQLVTYSMKNLCVDEGEVKILEEKDEGVHAHTVVFEAPPAFRAIEKLAKEPLDQDALRLAITNYISDEKLIECCATEGPHVGRVVFLRNSTQVNHEQVDLLSSEQILTNVGSLNLQCKNFNLNDLKVVQSFAEAELEEPNQSFPWFFFSKSESKLLTSEDSKQVSEKNKEVPSFNFRGTLNYVMPSEVIAVEFLARLRFILSRENSNITQEVTDDLPKDGYKLNLNMTNYFEALDTGSVLKGFNSVQEMEFFALLFQNSTSSAVSFMHQKKFLQLSTVEKSQWLKKKEGFLILHVSPNESIAKIESEGLKVVFFASDEVSESEKLELVRLMNLDCESAVKLKKEELSFFGRKVIASEIFSQNLLEEVTVWEILNFKCDADTKSVEPYVPQVISNDIQKYPSFSSFADFLLFGNTNQRIHLISSGAGMGKTRYLEELCEELRRKKPSNWVAHIDLSRCCDQLNAFKNSGNLEAAEFICSATSVDESATKERNFQIKCKVLNEKIESLKAWILLDSVDEVCPMYRQEVKKLMQILEAMGANLVVATRPREEETVVDTSLINAQQDIHRLNFLEEVHVKEFLSNDPKYDKLIAVLESKTTTEFREVLKIPRFLHITASIAEQLKSTEQVNEAELYESLLEKSLELTLSDKMKLDGSNAASTMMRVEKKQIVMELLGKLALDAVRHEGLCDWITNDEAEGINVFDFASISNGKVSFVHNSFAEFLCARYILDAVLNPSYVNKEIYLLKKTEINNCLTLDVHRTLRKMLDNCCNLNFTRGKSADKKSGITIEKEKVFCKIILEKHLSLYKFFADFFDLFKEIKIENESKLPLNWALKFGNDQFIDLFLSQGAKPSTPWLGGKKTILHWAVINKYNHVVTQHFDKLKASLDAKDGVGMTALHYAAQGQNEEIVRFLLEKGADWKAVDKVGKMALHHAVEFGNEENSKILLEKGHTLTKNNETCLHLAAKFGHLQLVQLLAKTESVNAKTKDKSTPLSLAIANGHMDVAEYLYGDSTQRDRGDTLLHLCAAKGDLEMVKQLAKKLQVDIKNKVGITPLQKATFHGHVGIAEFLFDQGADSNIKDNLGRTLLHAAAAEGHLELVRFVEPKLEVNVRDNSGATSLHLAALGGHCEVITYLLGVGADLNAEDHQGNNCLHFGAKSGNKEVVRCFEQRQVAFKKNKYGQFPPEL
jgi:ankyrin repeat protein